MTYVQRIGLSASEDRLENLLGERLAPNANKEAIDARIWALFGEEWAVMFTDLSGFSRNAVAFGIIHFLQVIQESQRLVVPCIDSHDGILLKSEGDSLLVIFRRIENAVACAIRMQQVCQDYSRSREPEEQINLCIGLGFGQVLRIGDHNVYGAEVNAAAKLGEDIAETHEILVTESVRNETQGAYGFEPISEIPPGANSAFRLLY
jgi:class 3 adenylate cyclase